MSRAALKSLVNAGGKHRESSSRYELYAEEHEDVLASKEMADNFTSGQPSPNATNYPGNDNTENLIMQPVTVENSQAPAQTLKRQEEDEHIMDNNQDLPKQAPNGIISEDEYSEEEGSPEN